MENKEKNQWMAIPMAVLVGAGVAWAGSQGGSKAFFGLPVFALCVALAYLIQLVAFIPAFIFQTEKFFDLLGSLTYITITILAVVLTSNVDARGYLLLGMVLVWAGRLGTFLFIRVLQSGQDSRFEDIKPSFVRFLTTWTLQGLWVTLTLAAALTAITTTVHKDLGIFALIGFIIWAFGFTIEAVADAQKRQFRSIPENKGKFIHTGLWAWSRHPNYFGEITLWVGVAVIALPVLQGWQWVTLISPVFVVLLITQISGIPMLEEKADKRWGGQEDYECYKNKTPVLIPRRPKKD